MLCTGTSYLTRFSGQSSDRSGMLSPHLTREEQRGLRLCAQLRQGWRWDVKPNRLIPWLAHGACRPWTPGQSTRGVGVWPEEGARGLWGWPPSSPEPSFMCMTNGGPDIGGWASLPHLHTLPQDCGLCKGAGTTPGVVSHRLPSCSVGSNERLNQ